MNYYFAPMEGITGYVYRNAHHRYFPGVDQYFTPFIATTQNHKLGSRERNDILPKNNAGVPLIPQILTNNAEDFIWAAREAGGFGYREVNLNLGCPSGTVVAKYKGAGFLSHPDKLDRFFAQVFQELERDKIAVSVKTRIGMESPGEFEELLKIYNRYPIKELIIHPRVRSDFYANRPNMAVFQKAAVESKNPVCYNGDICKKDDFVRFLNEFPKEEYPLLGSVMIGRGALSDPGLFARISGQEEGRETVFSDKNIWKAFHDQIFEGYREIMSGDRNTLFKMKELWFYLSRFFCDGENETAGCLKKDKYIKKIKKAQKADEYSEAVAALFDVCQLKIPHSMVLL